jgi:hypothetical protein
MPPSVNGLRGSWWDATGERQAIIANPRDQQWNNRRLIIEHPLTGTDDSGWGYNDSQGDWQTYHLGPLAEYVDIGRILELESGTRAGTNICGPLAVLAGSGYSLAEGLRLLSGNASMRDKMVANQTMQPQDIISMFQTLGIPARVGDPVFSNNRPPTPEDLKAALRNGPIIALVVANESKGGLLERQTDSGAGQVPHYVKVLDVFTGTDGQTYVQLYNPMNNQEEVYNFYDFKESWNNTLGGPIYTYVTADMSQRTSPAGTGTQVPATPQTNQ